ncbi:MAG: tetratricopeptide repeat protein [Myxococcales bacterium]|nr:tetratricopeptide repeat protein [Myxococcales bacterium]
MRAVVGSGTLRGAFRAGPTLDGADAGELDDDDPLRQSTLDGDDEPEDEDPHAALRFERGATIDRYTILDCIGAGAMGVVYTAYDPRLDRRIALKVMHAKPGAQASDAVARVLREAQALARLQHPHVVTVYDANALGELVYLTMELVDGPSLTTWLRAAPRTIAATLEVFVAAGRGLAAAHAVGLIHRDFKPDNVLVGNDGRVRVVDFGIARGADGPDLLNVEAALERSLHGEAAALTRSGEASLGRPPAPIDAAASTNRPPPPRAMVAELSPGGEPPAGMNLPYASTDRGAVPAWARTHDLADTQKAEGAARMLVSGEPPRVLSSQQLETVIPGLSSVRLTRTGALVGTPAYMAPEQHVAARVDARADQFAFCVALYEALYKVHPFPAKNYVQLSLSVLGGKVDPMLTRTDVPVRVRKAILRGLRVDPADRFADMDELLKALTYDPELRRRRRWGAALVSAGASAALAFAALEVFGGTPPCEGVERRLGGVYDEAARRDIEAAFLATDQRFAGKVLESSLAGLDRWSGDWAAQKREACEATHVHHEQSSDLLDRRTACLNRHLRSLAATVAVFKAADRDVVRGAVQAVDGLPDLAECADVERLRRGDGPPGAQREQVEQIDELLAQAEAARLAVRYDSADTLAGEALAKAQSFGLPRLEIQSGLLRGRLAKNVGRYADAARIFSDAAMQAERVAADDLRAEAWGELGVVLGNLLHEGAEAERLLRHTEGLLERIGGSRQERARLHEKLGMVLSERGRVAEAIALLDQAAREVEAVHGDRSTRLFSVLNTRGTVHAMQGDFERALADYERALAICKQHMGPEHPDVASILQNIGLLQKDRGELAAARENLERSLAIRRQALGELDPDTATSLLNMGTLLRDMEAYDVAAEHFEAALKVFRVSGSPLDTALTLYNLGIVFHLRGDFERALPPYREALVLREREFGPDHGEVAYPLTGLGTALAELRRGAEARPFLERALAIRGREGPDAVDLGEIRFALARIVEGEDPERGAALAALARADYVRLGQEDVVRSIDEWLAVAAAVPRRTK